MHFGIRKKEKKTKPNLTGPLGAQYPNPSRAWHFRSRRRRLCSYLSPTLSSLPYLSLSSHLYPPSRLSLYRVRQARPPHPSHPTAARPSAARPAAAARRQAPRPAPPRAQEPRPALRQETDEPCQQPTPGAPSPTTNQRRATEAESDPRHPFLLRVLRDFKSSVSSSSHYFFS
jgi:hypothetical protein